jgi:phosphoglycolate phosphatase
LSRAVFFDLDGTLTDPKDGILRCIRYALEQLGRDCPPDEQLTAFIGPPLVDSFRSLIGDADAPAALKYYRERFSASGWRENRPYDGIAEVLAGLQGRGDLLYLATSKPRVFAERILSHFGFAGYFAGIFGAELDGTHGDKCELLHYAKDITGTGNSAVMVGDRKFDMLGGRANGMRTLGVGWGFGTRDELEAAGADRIVWHPEGLPDALAELPGGEPPDR